MELWVDNSLLWNYVLNQGTIPIRQTGKLNKIAFYIMFMNESPFLYINKICTMRIQMTYLTFSVFI
jgi:hypothetical protein